MSEHYLQETANTGAEQQKYLELASVLHDIWREPRKLEDGTYEPRVKVLVGLESGKTKWVNDGEKPKGSTEIFRQDIANTPFEQLYPTWQDENLFVAGTVLELLGNQGGIPTKVEEVEGMASGLHDEWLARPTNSWAKGTEIDAPFANISDEEQAKDRNIVYAGMAFLESEKALRNSRQDLSAEQLTTERSRLIHTTELLGKGAVFIATETSQSGFRLNVSEEQYNQAAKEMLANTMTIKN